jgi:exodeoxyribonuclease VIII
MSLKKISEKAYRDADGLNKSLLVPFMRSPKHYLEAIKNPIKPTASMNLGSALHAELLRPEISKDIYAVMRKVDKRTNQGKEYAAKFEEENAGKIVIDEEQNINLVGMREAVMAHPAARRMIESSTHREQALFGNYKASSNVDHAFKIKAMADGIVENEGIIFDIKTSESGESREFAKKVRAFRYDIQQVHYTYAAVCNNIQCKRFPFIVVENTAPWGVVVYNLDPEKISAAWDEWRLAMDFYAHCHQKQDFNIGYSQAEVVLKF